MSILFYVLFGKIGMFILRGGSVQYICICQDNISHFTEDIAPKIKIYCVAILESSSWL